MQILLMTVIFVAGPTVQGCFNKDVRLITVGEKQVVQFCQDGNWRAICRNGDWMNEEANVVCNQLGYSNRGATAGWKCQSSNTVSGYLKTVRCEGSESSLAECMFKLDATCNQGNCGSNRKLHATVQCLPADCDDRDIRLVDGSTYREGRVEVCMGGRWGTACNNNQEGLAGAVCAQLGFPAEVAPIYQCNLNTEGRLSCTTAVGGPCAGSLGTECQTHQTVAEMMREECQEDCEAIVDESTSTCRENCTAEINQTNRSCNKTINETLMTCNRINAVMCNKTLNETLQGINNRSHGSTDPPQYCDTSTAGALGGVVSVLLVVIVVLTVGWTLTCVAIGNRNIINKKQTQTDSTEPTSTINRQFANPVYDSTTDNNYSSNGQTYELVDTNEGTAATYSDVNRENLAPELIAGNEDHDYHVLEAGPGEGVRGCDSEGACDYEVPVSRQSQVPLCEEEYSTLKH